jgi:hypothetical protein
MLPCTNRFSTSAAAASFTRVVFQPGGCPVRPRSQWSRFLVKGWDHFS